MRKFSLKVSLSNLHRRYLLDASSRCVVCRMSSAAIVCERFRFFPFPFIEQLYRLANELIRSGQVRSGQVILGRPSVGVVAIVLVGGRSLVGEDLPVE